MKGASIDILLLLPVLMIAALARPWPTSTAVPQIVMAAQATNTVQAPVSSFQAIELWLDSGNQPLAAYQLEFKATAGAVKIVGIEGGEHAAFRNAPYYDPAAMQHERVIIGAFSTSNAANLPVGKSRIATIHVQVTGNAPPAFTSTLTTCATVNGRVIPADITWKDGQSS